MFGVITCFPSRSCQWRLACKLSLWFLRSGVLQRYRGKWKEMTDLFPTYLIKFRIPLVVFEDLRMHARVQKNTKFIAATRSLRSYKFRNRNNLRACLDYKSDTVACSRLWTFEHNHPWSPIPVVIKGLFFHACTTKELEAKYTLDIPYSFQTLNRFPVLKKKINQFGKLEVLYYSCCASLKSGARYATISLGCKSNYM